MRRQPLKTASWRIYENDGSMTVVTAELKPSGEWVAASGARLKPTSTAGVAIWTGVPMLQQSACDGRRLDRP